MQARLFLPALIGIALAACEANVNAPFAQAPALDAGGRGGNGITVMSRNVYVGADLDAVLGALMSPDPGDDFVALQAAIATLTATDLPTRAQGFAQEIARTHPDVIGLQEISQLNIHLGPLGLPVDIDLDFLPTIQAALADAGLTYAVGGLNQNIEVSLLGGAIHLVDYDVVLYDPARVQWHTLVAKTFEYNLGEVAPDVVLKRGYVAGTATVDGQAYAVVSTHPEPDLGGIALGDLRAAQLTEIVTVLAGADRAIVLGDLNDTPGSPMYQVLTTAGFTDVWAALRPQQDGFTCCHLGDLSDPGGQFVKRIDYVFARGFGGMQRDLSGWIRIVGDDSTDRLQGPIYPIWPSDHGGVATRLLVPGPGAQGRP